MKQLFLYSIFLLSLFFTPFLKSGSSAGAGAIGGIAGFMIGRATAPRETQTQYVREVQYIDTSASCPQSTLNQAKADISRLQERIQRQNNLIDELSSKLQKLERENKRLKDENKDLEQETIEQRKELREIAKEARKMKREEVKTVEKLEK